MLRLTRQRLAMFGILMRGPATVPGIMGALGISPEYTCSDYARVHRIIMNMVREGVVSHQKNRRHHASTFALTPLGWERIAGYRRKYETHLQLLNGPPIPAGTAAYPNTFVSPPPPASLAPASLTSAQPDTGAGVKCPVCGETVPLARAKTLVDAGSRVVCRCTNDLTTIARDALAQFESA